MIEDGFGLPDEHAGVPGEGGVGEVLLSEVFFGFFFEGLDAEEGGEIGEGFAALDVAEAGGGVGGGDAEGKEEFGVLFHGIKGGAEGGLENIDWLDDVVGGEDGEGGFGVAFVKDGGGESDGVGGVAAHRFAQELGLGEEGEIGEDLVGVRRQPVQM